MPSWCFFDGSNGIPGAGQAASSALDPWNVGNCIVQSTVQSNPIHCLRSLLVTRRMVLGVLGNHFTGIISSVACSVCFKESTGSFNLSQHVSNQSITAWLVCGILHLVTGVFVCLLIWFDFIWFDLFLSVKMPSLANCRNGQHAAEEGPLHGGRVCDRDFWTALHCTIVSCLWVCKAYIIQLTYCFFRIEPYSRQAYIIPHAAYHIAIAGHNHENYILQCWIIVIAYIFVRAASPSLAKGKRTQTQPHQGNMSCQSCKEGCLKQNIKVPF